MLLESFSENRGVRGAHFYDSSRCEFLPWDTVVNQAKEQLPENFHDKLVEAIANYDPQSEFVTVSAGKKQITIELFKIQDL